jgi:recombination protein RecA
MKDITEILASLSPKTRGRVLEASKVEIERQPTPSLSLNAALKGGLGYGRQVLIWGNKSAGKSAFLLQLVGMAQKEGKVCAWIDAEDSYDPEWAARLGVDSEQLILSPAKTVNDMVDVGVDLMKAGVDILVVDSISALLPGIYFEKDSDELKELSGTKQIGAEAKDMTHAVKMLNYVNDNTLLILVSQQRNSFGSMHATHIPTGGMAVKFFSSTIIKLWSSEADKNQKKEDVAHGDRLHKQTVGRGVDWTIDYNKLGPQFLTGKYDFYFDGDFVGVDQIADLLDTCEEYGVLPKGSTWYTFGEEKIQGRAKAVKYLRDNPEILKELKASLEQKF